MNKYAVYDQYHNWLFDIHAVNATDAFALAKERDAKACGVELIHADI